MMDRRALVTPGMLRQAVTSVGAELVFRTKVGVVEGITLNRLQGVLGCTYEQAKLWCLQRNIELTEGRSMSGTIGFGPVAILSRNVTQPQPQEGAGDGGQV